jgi:opacity protein-like surface antigen
MRMHNAVWAGLVIGILLAGSKTLWGEGFADIGVGAAITDDANVTEQSAKGVVAKRSDFGTSFAVATRIGYWFEGAPLLGVAASVSYYQTDVDLPSVSRANLTVIPLSLLAMARWPVLVSDEFPNGRLQPYVGVGPGLFITDVSPQGFSDTSHDIGLDVRAGGTWLLTSHVGWFVEYRYTHVSPSFMDRGIQEETGLATHHFLSGAAYHF